MTDEPAITEEEGLLVRVYVPDVKAQKCVVVNQNDSVWAAKQVVLEKLNQDLPNDPLNYSLYLPPSGVGKLGKYLDDGRQLSDYTLKGHVPKLELRYKTRDYSIQVSLSEKAIAKANSRTNQRKMTEYIVSGSVKKVEKLLESGLDPNFVTEDGNTPLGLACGRSGQVPCIMPLLSGGAHIDFRGRDGLTPLHRAAIGGNAQAIKILLAYGATPNYRDAKILTPVYHTAIMGDDTSACVVLLKHRAELGSKDQGGWTELHQTAKYGHLRHADLFIQYGADMNAQNLVGNTPLHVAASHGQTRFAMQLLKRGADKMKLNYSNQSPGQVAILCGHHQLATEIGGFSMEQIEPIMEPPDYNPRARRFDPKLFMEKSVNETCPLSPPPEVLVGTLSQDWDQVEDVPPLQSGRKGSAPSVAGDHLRSGSAASKTSSAHTTEKAETESSSSMDQDKDSISTHSGSTAGTPGHGTPVSQHRGFSTFHHQRERLYRAGPGKYVSMEDIEPQQAGDLPLRKGMAVEVVYIGKGGYWEGRAGGRLGWFPALSIREISEEEEVDHGDVPAAAAQTVSLTVSPSDVTETEKEPEREMEEDDRLDEPISFGKRSNIREVVVHRGSKGFGFAMRGVKATKSMQFHPTPQVPALQYVGNVDPGGCADQAGLQTGDFLIEVNGYNVTYSTHDEVVNIVRKSSSSLRMKIITPLIKPKSTSIDIRDRLTPASTPEPVRRSDSPVTFASSHGVGSFGLQDVEERLPREVQYSTARKIPTFKESPILGRIDRTGWDSSQENSPSPVRRNRFTYHIPPMQDSHTRPPGVKMYPISSTSNEQSPWNPSAGKKNVEEETLRTKSATLPLIPPKDYPKVRETVTVTDLSPESPPSDEAEEHHVPESAFTRAIKEKMDTLKRPRANTMPMQVIRPSTPTLMNGKTESGSSPRSLSPPAETVKQQISVFEKELQQASHNRSRRASLNQVRITDVTRSEDDDLPSSIASNPIARAVLRKIDSVALDDSESQSGSGEEFGSPQNSPLRMKESVSVAEASKFKEFRGPPPAVKPKPLRKVKTDFDMEKQLQNISQPRSEAEATTDASPWNVQLKRTPKSERKFQASKPEVDQGKDGEVNWKSILKPAKRVDDGKTSSPLTATHKQEYHPGEITTTRQLRQALPGSPQGTQPIVAGVFEKLPSTGVTATPDRHGIQPQTSTEGISLFEESNIPAAPKYYQHKSGETAFDERYWVEGVAAAKLTTENGTHDPHTDDSLPPPLSPTDKRLSATSIENLPPPDAFISIEGVDSGETSTDDFILPPPLQHQTSSDVHEESPSPPPPPPPSTSPPKFFPSSAGIAELVGTDTATDGNMVFSKPRHPSSPSPLIQLATNPPDRSEIQNDYMTGGQSSEKMSPNGEGSIPDDADIPPPVPTEPPPPLDLSTSLDEQHQDTTIVLPHDTEIQQSVESQELTQHLVEHVPPPVEFSQQESVEEGVGAHSPPPRPPPPDPALIQSPPKIPTSTNGQASMVAPEGQVPPKQGFAAQAQPTIKPQPQVPPNKQTPVQDWSIEDVCQWLKDIGLSEHCKEFAENEIIGEHLATLTKEDLKELGVKKLGHQKTFLAKLSQL